MTVKRRDAIKMVVIPALMLAVAIAALMRVTDTKGKPQSPSSEERIRSLEQKVARLQHMEDVNAIQNLMSKMSYLYEAAMYEERLNYVSRKTPGVKVEIGGRGVFEGFEGARRTMVDVEKGFEHSHALGMKEKFPDVKLDDKGQPIWDAQRGTEHAGEFESELLGTPVIEIAADGKTAKGMWMSLMVVGKAVETKIQVANQIAGPNPQAAWIWWKSSADFVKEGDEWKIWHYLKNPYWATPYAKDWVEFSLDRPPVPPACTVKGRLLHGSPDGPTTLAYDSYRITREPKLLPKPPEPYQTFDPKEAYSSPNPAFSCPAASATSSAP